MNENNVKRLGALVIGFAAATGIFASVCKKYESELEKVKSDLEMAQIETGLAWSLYKIADPEIKIFREKYGIK